MSMQIRSENLCLSELGSIELAIESNKHLDSKMNEIIRSNHPIDVSKAMTNLASVGKILNLAYAGSKGFKCSKSIIKILSKYQSITHDSCLTCSTFVSECLSSLKNHKCAISLAEKDKLKEALKAMKKCSESASKMVEASEKLVNQADELCKLSEEALTAASGDESVPSEEKMRIADLIKDSRAKQAVLEAKTSSFYEQINEIQEEKQRIDRRIDQEADRENTHQIFNLVFSSATSIFKSLSFLTNYLSLTDQNNNNQDQTISRSEMLYQKEKELSDSLKVLGIEKRTSNALLAETRTILNDLSVQDKDLKASIKSLELTIKALGKIRTTFESTRRFWIGVKNDSIQLSNQDTIKSYVEADLKDEVIEELRSSGLQWLSLGKINYMAKEAIEDVSKQADHLMNNLPTKSEAVRILQDEAENLRFILTSD